MQVDRGASSDPNAAVCAYVDAVAQSLGIPVPAGCREGVIANLALIFTQNAPLMALDLSAVEEAAPVFRP